MVSLGRRLLKLNFVASARASPGVMGISGLLDLVLVGEYLFGSMGFLCGGILWKGDEQWPGKQCRRAVREQLHGIINHITHDSLNLDARHCP